MHIYIEFSPVSPMMEVPIQYNHLIQGMVYNNINPELAHFLHEEGFEGGGRTFKLFAFSRLGGAYEFDKEKGVLRFTDSLRLTISSPVTAFCESLANVLLSKGAVQLGGNRLEVRAIEAVQQTVFGEQAVLQTLSPITAYSTMLRLDGRKYTCYYQPGDPDFNEIIANNLRKKYQALYAEEPPPGEVGVTRMGDMRMNVVNYKNTVIKGYSGKIRLTGPQELLQIAVDAGLGSKNSQGFGCVRVLQQRSGSRTGGLS